MCAAAKEVYSFRVGGLEWSNTRLLRGSSGDRVGTTPHHPGITSVAVRMEYL